MSVIKCALHVHTNLSDASLAPEEALKNYADQEFGCVAITDHEFLLRDNYTEIVRKAPAYGMLVMVGVEIDYKPWNYQHLLRIEGKKQTLHIMAHPSAYYMEIDEVKSRLSSEPFPIDAIEITHRGFYTPKYDTPEIPRPKIASDDAHEPYEFGRAWIEMQKTKNPDDVIRAVKAGEFQTKFFRR